MCRDGYDGTQAGRYGTMRHRPLETLESGEGSQSEHNTQLSVEGEGEGSGPMGEWERERERGEDSQRPKSADSLMKVGDSVCVAYYFVIVCFLCFCLFLLELLLSFCSVLSVYCD